MKSLLVKGVVAIVVLAAGVLLYMHLHEEGRIPEEAAANGSVARAMPVTAPRNLGIKSKTESFTASSTARGEVADFAGEFSRSTNYYTFVQTALAAAKLGDRDAAYYLAAALAYCDDTYRFYFQAKDKVLSVDEAIAYRARFPGPSMTDAIRRADGRCHDVYDAHDPNWGTADMWMEKAAEAGQPAAQVRVAGEVLLKVNADGSSGLSKYGSQGEIRNVSNSRELVRTALATNNPEAIFQVGDLLGMLRPDMQRADVVKESLVWKYAACLSGMDCSSNANWVFQTCMISPLNCQPGESGVDYLLGEAASLHMADFELKASQLTEKIYAKKWADLGLSG